MGLAPNADLRTVATGTITDARGQEQPILVETAGVDRIRHDIGNGHFVFVSNSGRGFLEINGAKQPLRSWAAQYKRPENLPALSLMTEFTNPNLQIKYIGEEKIGAQTAHHIRLSMLPEDGFLPEVEDRLSEFHIYIDRVSLNVIRTTHFDFSPETAANRSPVDIVFSDYRTQDGAQVPFHMTRYLAGHKDSEINFTSISLNAVISDSDFR